ncbi:hypothetical protein SUGI_0354950 [Cryptomeria japonica]|nr:hypothetical protein SUGI_0354950 [Cryptomeria japonica]
MTKEWCHLIPPSGDCVKPLKDRSSVKWWPPPVGWVKLNFNEASSANLGKFGCGFIIRNYFGKAIWMGDVCMEYGTNNDAEFFALHEGLRLCCGKKLDHIAIEGDSKLVIDSIITNTIENWKFCPWIAAINNFLSQLDFTLTHTYREGNYATDFLS